MAGKKVQFAHPVVQQPTVQDFALLPSPDRLDSFGSVRACDDPSICRATLLKAADSIARRIHVNGFSGQTDAAAALLYVGETYLVRHFNLSEDADADRDAALIVMEQIRATVRLHMQHQIDWSAVRAARDNERLAPRPWQVAILFIQTALDLQPEVVKAVGDQLRLAVNTESAQHLAAATAHESDPSHATRRRGREGVPVKLRYALGGDGGWNVMHHGKRLASHMKKAVGDGFSSQVPRLVLASGLVLGAGTATVVGAPVWVAGGMGLSAVGHVGKAAFGAAGASSRSVIAPVVDKLFSGIDRFGGKHAPLIKAVTDVYLGDKIMGIAGSAHEATGEAIRQGAWKTGTDVWNTDAYRTDIVKNESRLREARGMSVGPEEAKVLEKSLTARGIYQSGTAKAYDTAAGVHDYLWSGKTESVEP